MDEVGIEKREREREREKKRRRGTPTCPPPPLPTTTKKTLSSLAGLSDDDVRQQSFLSIPVLDCGTSILYMYTLLSVYYYIIVML